MTYRYRPGGRNPPAVREVGMLDIRIQDLCEITTRQGKDNVWYNFRCLAPACPRHTGFDVSSESAALARFAQHHIPHYHGSLRRVIVTMTPEERDVLTERILQGRKKMGKIEELQMQRSLLASQAERTLKQLDRTEQQIEEEQTKQADLLEKYGEDAFPEGTVITFRYQFPNTFQRGPNGEKTYRPMKYLYAAIKADDLWYTTGPKSPKAFTWQNLIDWWENGKVTKLHVVTKTERIGQ